MSYRFLSIHSIKYLILIFFLEKKEDATVKVEVDMMIEAEVAADMVEEEAVVVVVEEK